MTKPILSDIFSAAIPFVMARRKETGGFGATPMLPATIEDTYHALKIINLARKYTAPSEIAYNPTADGQLHSYLESRQQALHASVKTTFQMLWCCGTIGIAPDLDAVAADIIARLQADDSLETWYYGARTLTQIPGSKALPLIGSKLPATLQDQSWRTVDEAWMHMYISRIFQDNLPRPAPELTAWFQACQNSDGGFGFFPGTTSYMENCTACLKSLASLNASPLDPKRAFQFLTAAQNASGGFGRNSRTVAFLYSTRDALEALAILSEQGQ